MASIVALLSLGLFLWAVNALSILRDQMNDVIARLERIERAQKNSPDAPKA
jgi:hypothetical protein